MTEEKDNNVMQAREEVNRLIDGLTLFDDDLMSRVFDKNIAATELILRIILGRKIKVLYLAMGCHPQFRKAINELFWLKKHSSRISFRKVRFYSISNCAADSNSPFTMCFSDGTIICRYASDAKYRYIVSISESKRYSYIRLAKRESRLGVSHNGIPIF